MTRHALQIQGIDEDPRQAGYALMPAVMEDEVFDPACVSGRAEDRIPVGIADQERVVVRGCPVTPDLGHNLSRPRRQRHETRLAILAIGKVDHVVLNVPVSHPQNLAAAYGRFYSEQEDRTGDLFLAYPWFTVEVEQATDRVDFIRQDATIPCGRIGELFHIVHGGRLDQLPFLPCDTEDVAEQVQLPVDAAVCDFAAPHVAPSYQVRCGDLADNEVAQGFPVNLIAGEPVEANDLPSCALLASGAFANLPHRITAVGPASYSSLKLPRPNLRFALVAERLGLADGLAIDAERDLRLPLPTLLNERRHADGSNHVVTTLATDGSRTFRDLPKSEQIGGKGKTIEERRPSNGKDGAPTRHDAA
nr:hypothetical protein [uncultured Algimonas sp.]